MRLLPPQRLRPHYYGGVEQALAAHFRNVLFSPVECLLAEATTQAAAVFGNAAPAPSRELLGALRRGTIQYVGDAVVGEFDAQITAALRALGAQFDARAGVFRLPSWVAPAWFKAEALATQARAKNVHEALARELDRLQEKLETGMIPVPVDPAGPIEAIEDGFESAAAALGVPKRIPQRARAAMEKAYAEDVRPYVAKATAEYIDGLHRALADNAARGYRYEAIVKDVEYFVGVSERKARFLARQETSLFMAAYRRERFTGAGVKRYRWSTSHDVRVRPYAGKKVAGEVGDHRILDKQIFFYDLKAPAAYMSCAQPCNPGEDFNCRCADLAILE